MFILYNCIPTFNNKKGGPTTLLYIIVHYKYSTLGVEWITVMHRSGGLTIFFG